MHGSRRPRAARTRTRSLALFGMVVVASLGVWRAAGTAQAAVTSFVLSPGSGPPGTVVHVSGNGCAPGLLGSNTTNFVAVTATALDVVFRAPITASGVWSGTFTVPSTAPAGSSAPVTAVCVSTGLQSLTTIYAPQSFRVTGASPTTNPPTTGPGSGTTQPPGTTPGTIVTVPGDSTTLITTPAGDGSIGASGAPGGSRGSAHGTTPGTVGSGEGKRAAGDAAGAATLQQADLGALSPAGTGDGGLGWLGGLLLLALLLAAIGAPVLIRRARRERESADSIEGAR